MLLNEYLSAGGPVPRTPGCRYPGDPRPYVTLTFHTTDGTVVMHLGTWCFGQVEVTRDPDDLARVAARLLGTP